MDLLVLPAGPFDGAGLSIELIRLKLLHDAKRVREQISSVADFKRSWNGLDAICLQASGDGPFGKDVLGMFRMTFVGFNFPKGEDKFNMFVRDVDIKSVKIQEFGFNLLPLKVEDGAEDGLAACEITHHGQLGQAAKYIWIAYNCNLLKRQTISGSTDRNQPVRLKSSDHAK